jgi:glycosyltransferase involved in cell wall biosynthesis
VRIAIEALGADRPGGGRAATLNLLEALFERDRERQYTLFLTRPERIQSAGPNVRQVVSGPLPPLAARLWAQAVLPVYLAAWRADLVHHAKNLTVASRSCPAVVTVYDLTTLRYPELYSPIDGWYWRNVQPRALGAARRVIAISRTTADDLTRFYGRRVDPARIEVIYPAIAPRFSPTSGDPAGARSRYGIEGDFVLHVGSISRKKNLITLVRALRRVRAAGRRLKLVLVGRVYQKGQDRELGPLIDASGLRRDVLFTGPVPDEDLPGLYRAATAVAFPSLHEGFGIVPIEAMACGTPVVASRGGALAEAVADGGWLLEDGQDDVELAAALEEIVRDDRCRATLRRRGLARAAAFSPAATAEQTLALYRRVATGAA